MSLIGEYQRSGSTCLWLDYRKTCPLDCSNHLSGILRFRNGWRLHAMPDVRCGYVPQVRCQRSCCYDMLEIDSRYLLGKSEMRDYRLTLQKLTNTAICRTAAIIESWFGVGKYCSGLDRIGDDTVGRALPQIRRHNSKEISRRLVELKGSKSFPLHIFEVGLSNAPCTA